MKIKDLKTQEVIVIKYLACKMLIESGEETLDFANLIDNKVKERIAIKYGIAKYQSKSSNQVLTEIKSANPNIEGIDDVVSPTYDYILNKEFRMLNVEDNATFPDAIILRPTDDNVLTQMRHKFLTETIFIMHRKDFESSPYNGTAQNVIFAIDSQTGVNYAVVIQ